MKDLTNFKPSFCCNKKIVIVGFGSQGEAQSLNLKNSGFDVKIALREDSASRKKAEDFGFEVLSFDEGVKNADILMLLTPDESHSEFFTCYIRPNLKHKSSIIVAHGFSFHFGFIENYKDYNIGMVAPKAVGKAVRDRFISKEGIFSLTAKFNQVNNDLEYILPEIAFGIGSRKILETDFKTECESDLFGEQAVLCGGVVSLFKNAFDVMVEDGFPPLIAYYECVHELKLIVDLIFERGPLEMFSSISNAAKFGGLKTGDYLIDESVKQRMKKILQDIKDKSFAKTFIHEALNKHYQFKDEIKNKFKSSAIQNASKEVINLLK